MIKEEIAKSVIEHTGVNMFENTRKRDVVEARCLFVKIMRDEYFYGWTELAKYFASKNKPVNHATMIHAYNIFDEVKRTSPVIRAAYNNIMNTHVSEKAIVNLFERIRKLKHPNKFEQLNTLIDRLEN